MSALKPEINLSLFGRKKKIDPEAATTDEVLEDVVDAAQAVLTNTVEIAEEAIDRISLKLFVGAIVGGVILIAVNTAGKIITNALDNHEN